MRLLDHRKAGYEADPDSSQRKTAATIANIVTFLLSTRRNARTRDSLFTRPSGSFLSLSRILLGQFNQTSCILVLAENDHEASYEKERDPPKEENR